MDPRTEIREFLTSRRARITPEQAGLVSYGSRRVPGLRREEVAVLAGVSVPYYTRIERGDLNGVSDGVLEALARALQLDEAERTHLFDLARALRPTSSPRRRRAPKQRVRPSIQHVLDGLTGAPAFVLNARLDILAANELGYALYSDMFSRAAGPGPVNSARCRPGGPFVVQLQAVESRARCGGLPQFRGDGATATRAGARETTRGDRRQPGGRR